LQLWADAVDDQSYTFNNFVPYFERSLTFTPPDASLRAANATPEYDSSRVGTGSGPLSVTFGHYAQAFSSWAQASFKQLGIQPIKGFTSGNILGSSYQLLTIDGQTTTRDSSETSFLRKNGLRRPNLIVYQSTLAKRIIFDNAKTAVGVEIDIGNLGGITFILSATKEVIISAGAFQSPQLLMVSGVGPAATLRQNNIPVIADVPGVGQNMWDHILGGPSYRVNVLTTSALGNPAFSAQAADQFHASPPRGMLTNSGADLLAFEKIPKQLRSNFTPSALADLAKFPADWPELEYIPTAAYYGFQQNYIFEAPADGYNYATIATVLVAPLSRGTVGISSADMRDPPIINPNWLTHPTDQAVAVAGYKRARAFFEASAMKPVLIGGEYFPGANASVTSDRAILEFIRKSFGTVFHASCTCKMGNSSDAGAVLDARARVRGVKNLRVVDASSFPILPPGHPVATVCECPCSLSPLSLSY
jgi:choline dehydrogenase